MGNLLRATFSCWGESSFALSPKTLMNRSTKNPPRARWSGASPSCKRPLSAKLEHIKLNGEVVAEFKLDNPETTLGRTTGDLIFKDDPYMSGTHARIIAQPGRFLLQDLRSRNGVYRRVRSEIVLIDGDEFFMGEQLFHVEFKSVG